MRGNTEVSKYHTEGGRGSRREETGDTQEVGGGIRHSSSPQNAPKTGRGELGALAIHPRGPYTRQSPGDGNCPSLRHSTPTSESRGNLNENMKTALCLMGMAMVADAFVGTNSMTRVR